MSTVHTIDWGDVPTWVSALTTAGALIAAGFVVRIELKRDRRGVQAAERAEQADHVAVWHVDGDSRIPIARMVLRNGSNLPIYNVRVIVSGGGDVEPIPMAHAVPPGDHRLQYPSTFQTRSGETNIAVTFTDTAGRSWARHPDGQLVSLPDVYARTLHVPAESRTDVVPPESGEEPTL